MKLILEDEEIEEIKIHDILKDSSDKSIITIKGEFQGKRNEGKEDIIKEIIAYDAMAMGPLKASELHNIPHSSASKYKDGLDISDDGTRARVLSVKHNIADVAVTKLMDSLNLINLNDIEKPLDQVRAAGHLASIVEKMTESGKNGTNEVHLHLYGPKQKKLEQYEIIDV